MQNKYFYKCNRPAKTRNYKSVHIKNPESYVQSMHLPGQGLSLYRKNNSINEELPIYMNKIPGQLNRADKPQDKELSLNIIRASLEKKKVAANYVLDHEEKF